MAVKARDRITLTRVNDGAQGIAGPQGPTGPPGKGIKSTVITYQAGTSGTTPPTGTWESSIPSVSQGQYLWSKNYTTYTDNSTSTTYSVSYIPKNGQNGATGETGPQGPTGATGTGVASIVQQYYLSTSKNSQTGGAWGNSMPTWSSGKYLWTRYQINYKNPTSAAYTSPICDSSWEAVNEIQIGGRNYIKDSDFTYSMTNVGAPYTKSFLLTESLDLNELFIHPFTLSFYVRTLGEHKSISSGGINTRFGMHLSIVYKSNDGTEKPLYPFCILSPFGKNERVSHTEQIELPNDLVSVISASVSLQLTEAPADNNDEIWIFSRPKFELGNRATDWTPAPEDMDDTINEIYGNIEKNNADLTVQIESITATVESTYVTQTELDDYKVSVDSQIQQTASDVTMNFGEQISSLGDDTSNKFEEFYKYIKFDGENGITIGSGDNSITLTLDNEKGIIFSKNGETFGSWDGVDFHTGNIVVDVNERAQFGNFAYVPRSDGSLSFLKVK